MVSDSSIQNEIEVHYTSFVGKVFKLCAISLKLYDDSTFFVLTNLFTALNSYSSDFQLFWNFILKHK